MQSSCEKKVQVLVAQACPTICGPMDRSPPGSSVHGIPLGKNIGWAVLPFSRGSSQTRDGTHVSCTAGGFFTLSHHGCYRHTKADPLPSPNNFWSRRLEVIKSK